MVYIIIFVDIINAMKTIQKQCHERKVMHIKCIAIFKYFFFEICVYFVSIMSKTKSIQHCVIINDCFDLVLICECIILFRNQTNKHLDLNLALLR